MRTLFHPHQSVVLTPSYELVVNWRLRYRFRLWSWLVCGFALAAALSPIFDDQILHAPLYATVRETMGRSGMIAGWASVAVMAALAAITARPMLWRVACALMILCSSTWFLGVMWQHYVVGTPLSMFAQGMWIWTIISTLLVMSAPDQLIGEIDHVDGSR